MRIVVTGLIAAYPLGGVAMDYLSFLSGFRALGHDVFYLEDTGQWLYDPRTYTYTDDVSFHLTYLQEILSRSGGDMTGKWALRAPDGVYHGASLNDVSRFCRSADLFLNVSGGCWLRDEYRGAKRTAYLDSDPCYSQAKLQAVDRGFASEEQAYSVGLIRAHDCFFTFAENIRSPDCRIPACGIDWIPTRQPLILDDWPFHFDANAKSYTTVMSWKTDVTLPTLDGKTYGGKDIEFMKFIALPQQVGVPLEVAVSGTAPRDDLAKHGWSIVDAHAKSTSPDVYREYLRQSRGEWSIAKNAYVESRSGWFSTRSAAYLALGKPVIVQNTGFRPYYPQGEGIFAFDSTSDILAAFGEIEGDYRRQCEAAHATAQQEFAATRVLQRMLDDAGLS